jgi:hypothetical protein
MHACGIPQLKIRRKVYFAFSELSETEWIPASGIPRTQSAIYEGPAKHLAGDSAFIRKHQRPSYPNALEID